LREPVPGRGARIVLVTSPDSANARSVVALNLALCAGEDGERVLLVDGDREQQAAMMAITSENGADAEKLMSIANRVVATPWQRVKFLRVFQRAGTDQQAAYRIRDAIVAEAGKFDLVVVDGGLVLSDPYVRKFATFVDDVVVVAESGKSNRDRLQEAIEALGANRAKVAGAVLAA
jgi:Mrp family chromosome partitioning ATPase